MLNELETTAVVNQRITGDTSLLMIRLTEATINHHQFTVGLDGILTAGGMYRHMSIDDVAVRTFHAERIHDGITDGFIVAQTEIGAFLLLEGVLVGEEIAFEGGHLALVKQRRVFAAPEVQEIIDGILAFLYRCIGGECGTYHHARIMHQLQSCVFLAGRNLYFLQRAVVIERAGGMEEQVAVIDGIHTSMAQDGADVLMELLTYCERMMELTYEQLLLVGELVGVLGIDGGEMTTAHGVLLTVYGADAALIIYIIEEFAVLHIPRGLTVVDDCFLLELYH